VIAREYGLASWPKLVARVEELRAREGITPEIEEKFLIAAMSATGERIRRLVELYPGVTRCSDRCALVGAEPDLVARIDAVAQLEPRKSTPIEHVAYSRISRAIPERAEAQLACVRDLLARGADPNTMTPLPNNQGQIPVMYGACAEAQHPGIVRALLEAGANPNDGESIYHSAEIGRIDMLELLAEFGGSFGPQDEHLGFMCYYREFDANAPAALRGAKWLLARGVTPNVVRGEQRVSPLHMACRYSRNPVLIELLLDHGALSDLQDAEGNTAYQAALVAGNAVAIRTLEARGIHEDVNADNAFLVLCAANDGAGIQLALRHDPSVVERLRSRGIELMERCAEAGQVAGLAGLVAAAFPVDGTGDITPLHFACIRGQVESVRFLIEHGAALDIVESRHYAAPIGWTTFGWTMYRSRTAEFVEIIRLLMAAGAASEYAVEQLDEESYPDRAPEILDAIREGLAMRV